MTDLAPTSPIWTAAEQALIAAGQKAIMLWLVAKVPFLGLSLISPVAGFFAGLAAEFIMDKIDKIAFAFYVAEAVGGQVSDFLTAEELGDQQAIDAAGGNLVNLGKT